MIQIQKHSGPMTYIKWILHIPSHFKLRNSSSQIRHLERKEKKQNNLWLRMLCTIFHKQYSILYNKNIILCNDFLLIHLCTLEIDLTKLASVIFFHR